MMNKTKRSERNLLSSSAGGQGNSSCMDSLQFQIDGLFKMNSSVALRRKCAWTLFEICSSKKFQRELRQTKTDKALLNVMQLVATDSDNHIRCTLLLLCLMLIRDAKGSIRRNLVISRVMFTSLLCCCRNLIRQELNAESAMLQLQMQVERPTLLSSVVKSISDEGQSAIHLKRKLSGRRTGSVPPSSQQSSQDSDVALSNLLQLGNRIEDTSFLRQHSEIMPCLRRLLINSNSSVDDLFVDIDLVSNVDSDSQFCATLSLLVINRLLTVLVQRVSVPVALGSSDAPGDKIDVADDAVEDDQESQTAQLDTDPVNKGEAMSEIEDNCEDIEEDDSSESESSIEDRNGRYLAMKALLSSVQTSLRAEFRPFSRVGDINYASGSNKSGSDSNRNQLVLVTSHADEGHSSARGCSYFIKLIGEWWFSECSKYFKRGCEIGEHIAATEKIPSAVKFNKNNEIRLWLLLTVIESSCYQCVETQVEYVVSTVEGNPSVLDSAVEFIAQLTHGFSKLVSSYFYSKTPQIHGSSEVRNIDIQKTAALIPELYEPGSNRFTVSTFQLLLAALKALVAITNNNTYLGEVLSQRDALLDDKRHQPLQVVGDLIYFCATWREYLSQYGTTSDAALPEQLPKGSVLSPNEDVMERIVFDIELLALTLLTNVMNNCAFRKLCPFTKEKCKIAQDHFPPVVMEEDLFVPRGSENGSFQNLLVKILGAETKDYIDVIVSTQHKFDSAAAGRGSIQDKSPLSSQYQVKEDCEEDSQSTIPADNLASLPIAELVIASQVSLLLHALSKSIEASQDAVDIFNAVRFARPGAVSNETQNLINSLPRKSWWLPVRVLKAFLALQGQTGVVLYDSVQAILEAIKTMDATSAALLESVCGDEFEVAAARQLETVPTVERDDNWLFGSNVPSSSRRVSTVSTSCNTESDTSRRSKWKWVGHDYIYVDESVPPESSPVKLNKLFADRPVSNIVAGLSQDFVVVANETQRHSEGKELKSISSSEVSKPNNSTVNERSKTSITEIRRQEKLSRSAEAQAGIPDFASKLGVNQTDLAEIGTSNVDVGKRPTTGNNSVGKIRSFECNDQSSSSCQQSVEDLFHPSESIQFENTTPIISEPLIRARSAPMRLTDDSFKRLSAAKSSMLSLAGNSPAPLSPSSGTRKVMSNEKRPGSGSSGVSLGALAKLSGFCSSDPLQPDADQQPISSQAGKDLCGLESGPTKDKAIGDFASKRKFGAVASSTSLGALSKLAKHSSR